MSQFMTIRQTARETGISESLIRRLVRDGACPGFQSGNRYIVDVQALLDVLHEMSARG